MASHPAGPHSDLVDSAYPDDAGLLHEDRRALIDFRQLVTTFRANLIVIAAIVGAALALALIATLLDTKRYTASASVQINDQSQRVLGSEVEADQATNNGRDIDRFLQTQLDVLKSRTLAERVIKRLRLDGSAAFYTQMEAARPASGTPPAIVRELTLGLLRENMEVKLPRNSRIATITFESTDPALSAQVANAFAEEFIQASLQQRFDSSAYARTFVAGQLQDAKLRLEESERNLNAYARQAGLIKPRDLAEERAGRDSAAGASSLTAASLMQLNAATAEAKANRIAAEARVRGLRTKSPLTDGEALQNQAVQALFTRRAEIGAKLQDALTRHLEGHPSVRQLQAQLTATDEQLDLAAQSVRNAAQADYDAARTTENQLSAQVDALKAATMAEQDLAVEYNLLAREADTNRALYDGLLQRYKELNASAGISTSNITVIDRADPPTMPSSPNLLKNLALALLGGLGLAGMATFLRSQFDDIVRVPEDIESKLHLPLLGVVPLAELEPELSDPKSAVNESYNSLRSALLYSTSQGLPRTILVSSSQPSEGKTTTSSELAQGFARMGRRVLLVDVDLRRPSLHNYLGLTNGKGMSSLLTRQDGLDDVIQPGGQENLAVITSGPVPPSPTELIASSLMEQLVEEMAARFDVVIFDSPPILGLADAPLMSALVDGVVFIVESGRGRHGSLKASLRRLRAMRPMLLGAVLTKFDPAKARHGSSDYSGYEYYRYDAADKAA